MSVLHPPYLFLALVLFMMFPTGPAAQTGRPENQRVVEVGPPESVVLPLPYATPPARNVSKVIGWPYSYYGQNEDPRKKGERPDLVAKAIKPDYAVGSHVAAHLFRRDTAAAPSSACAAHGTGRAWSVTRWPSSPSRTAGRPDSSRIS